MEHQFNTYLASQYGIEEAIIIHNMFFWIRHNVANRKHYHDEKYWTYNSAKALSELFPYMSESKVTRCLKILSEKEVILKGNYNKQPFDRTCWYAFTDKFVSFLQNIGMDLFVLQNGDTNIEEPIPDSKQQIENTNNKLNKEDTNVSKKDEHDWRKNFDMYMQIVTDAQMTLHNDNDFFELMIKYHPNVNYDKTIDKAVELFWGTEAGWMNKKKSRSKNIDMVATIKNNFNRNIVYKQKGEYDSVFYRQQDDNSNKWQ